MFRCNELMDKHKQDKQKTYTYRGSVGTARLTSDPSRETETAFVSSLLAVEPRCRCRGVYYCNPSLSLLVV